VPKAEVATRQPRGIVRFFRETVAELKKVSWPTRQEATQLTLLVLVVVGLSGMILGLLDFLFTELFRLVIGL
jgi:preprotein translocase subunit SecE